MPEQVTETEDDGASTVLDGLSKLLVLPVLSPILLLLVNDNWLVDWQLQVLIGNTGD